MNMLWFDKKAAPAVSPAQEDKKTRFEAWLKFIEQSCHNHLGEVLNFQHPEWKAAEEAGDFRTLVTMYTAASTAYEQHADHMFTEWMKGGKACWH
jgi:hypothetical protein